MNRKILSIDQIEDLVSANKYPIHPTVQFYSRCIEGGYENAGTTYPLAIAGADAGELAVLYASANLYGFTIDPEKAYSVFLEVIGGPEHFSLHSSGKPGESFSGEGCVHMRQIFKDYESYSLEKNQIEIISAQIKRTIKNGAEEIILKSVNQEGAVLQVQGEWGLYPQFRLSTLEGTQPVQVYIFHKTLADRRHRELAKQLIGKKAVELFNGLDEEYLYQVISSTTEDHFFETMKRIGSGLPMYEVNFEVNGSFAIKELGNV